MKTRKQTIGARGEKLAEGILKKAGLRIIDRNYRSSHYEIDLIARDKECVVFVEVKARSCTDPENMAYGRPAHAVTHSKQSFLIGAARAYLRENSKLSGMRVRFDVIEIFFDSAEEVKDKKVLKTNHIKNAFGA